MRMPRVRFKVWHLILLVAIVAPLCGAAKLSRVARSRLGQAAHFAQCAQGVMSACYFAPEGMKRDEMYVPPPLDATEEEVDALYAKDWARRKRWAAHYASLSAKYEHAAWLPFLPVAADRPSPE